MEDLKLLNRREMKMIKAGSAPECAVYADGEWDCHYHRSEAEAIYHSVPNVTGYCCASCGETGFLGASVCNEPI